MEFYFTLFIGFACVICVSGQTTTKICWDTKWYNDSIQAPNNRSNYEHQSSQVLDKICSIGSVIAAKCKDDKGEPFKQLVNNTANQFIATCDPVNGLICKPYNNSENATCPDFAIQYGCNCPSTQSTGMNGGNITSTPGVGATGSASGGNSGGTGAGAATLKSGSGNTGTQTTGSGTGTKSPGQRTGQSRNNGNIYGISQYVLLLHLMIQMLLIL